jgi:hypothetical protein
MRTKTLLIAAVAMAAGIASSVAQSNVYSLNVVGYINKEIAGGNKYTGVANNLNGTNNTLPVLFGANGSVGLPGGSAVLKWYPGALDFTTYPKLAGPGFTGAGATTTLNPGEGALIRNAGATYTNTFVGEVPQGALSVSNSSAGLAYQLVSNPTADSGTANALGLGSLTGGSAVLLWTRDQGGPGIDDWKVYGKLAPANLWAAAGIPQLDVAEGFLLRLSTSVPSYIWSRNFTVQ